MPHELSKEAEVDVHITYLQPEPQPVRFTVTPESKLQYEVGGRLVAWNGLPMNVVILKDFRGREIGNDKNLLSSLLGLEEWQIENLVGDINRFPYSNIRKMKFIEDEDGISLQLEFLNRRRLCTLGTLSGGERSIVWMEFATAAARHMAQFCPTVLVLDYPFMLSDTWFSFFQRQLLDPINQFQTLMCVPTQKLDLDGVGWLGWEVIRFQSTEGKEPSDGWNKLSQEPKLQL